MMRLSSPSSLALPMALLLVAPGLLASPFAADFDPESATGVVRYRDRGRQVELARRRDWVPEELVELELAGRPAVVALWRTFPRRQYLSVEVHAAGEDGAFTRVHPTESGLRPLYQGAARVDTRRGRRPRLRLEFSLSAENFTPPLPRKRETWLLGPAGSRRLSRRHGEVAGAEQLLNVLADLLDEGEREAAEARARELPEEPPEFRQRFRMLLTHHARTPEERLEMRRDLAAVADQGPGALSMRAADRLLRMTAEEALDVR